MLLAQTNVSCQACLAMQQRVEQEARIKPKTLKCFTGLCETAVPVRVGENIVAWLETGHILLSIQRVEIQPSGKDVASMGDQCRS
jgi:ligand-binding sensor protein